MQDRRDVLKWSLLTLTAQSLPFSGFLPLRNIEAQGAKPTTHESQRLTKNWKVLFRGRPRHRGTAALPNDSPLKTLQPFEFQGPRPGDPFLLGKFAADGQWGVHNGELARIDGKNAAVQLVEADDFDLQAVVRADGLGGWFCLIGWDDQSGEGYAVYNVTLKVSGSPWLVVHFRDRRGDEETHREFARLDWKGYQPLVLRVANKSLSLQVGRQVLAKNLALPDYRQGRVILGTYDTRYGPKAVRIRSLRMRAL